MESKDCNHKHKHSSLVVYIQHMLKLNKLTLHHMIYNTEV